MISFPRKKSAPAQNEDPDPTAERTKLFDQVHGKFKSEGAKSEEIASALRSLKYAINRAKDQVNELEGEFYRLLEHLSRP